MLKFQYTNLHFIRQIIKDMTFYSQDSKQETLLSISMSLVKVFKIVFKVFPFYIVQLEEKHKNIIAS